MRKLYLLGAFCAYSLIIPLSYAPAEADLLDYRIYYTQTHVYTESIRPWNRENIAAEYYGYVTVDTDDVYADNSPAEIINLGINYTSSFGETSLYQSQDLLVIDNLPVRDGYDGLSGSVSSSTGSNVLTHATLENLGTYGWGTNENAYIFRRGTYELVLDSSKPSDIVQNGRFPRSPCADIIMDLVLTCFGWSSSGLGDIRTIAWLQGTGNYVAELTAGSEAVLSQAIDIPNNPFHLNFDHLFTTTTGSLDVFLGSVLLGSIGAATSSDFINRSILVDDPGLLGQTGQALSFHLNGLTGSQVLLDNITATVVPIPPAVWLFGSGLLGLVGIVRRKKAA